MEPAATGQPWGSWRLGAAQAQYRTYHSTALLLPDGRVVSAGDDYNGGFNEGEDEAELFSPPYLFDGDDPAPRPVIDDAPASVGWGRTFDVDASGPAPARATLVAPGAVTHAVDMSQRFQELEVVAAGAGGLTLKAPPNGDVAPPGRYMLFVLDASGTPSVARWVQLDAGEPPPETQIDSGPSGTETSRNAELGFSSPASGVTFECRLDSGTFAACDSPRSYGPLARGEHTFEVRARAADGAVDETPASRTWTIAPPTLEIWAVGDGDAGADSDSVADRMAPVDRFLYLGDVYENGTAAEFQNDFDPVWGRFKAVTSPTPGNHDWGNRATGYDPYWGARAPQTAGGHYYSFMENGWQFISLNTQENMSPGSPQHTWLESQLAGPGNCRVAYFHRPRFSAGDYPDQTDVEPLWDLLAGRAVLALAGHDHNVQRYGPVGGVTQITAGTGGHSLYPLEPDPRRAYGNDAEDAALRLRLPAVGSDPGGGATLTHELVAADDGAVLDPGTVGCSPAAPHPVSTTFGATQDASVGEATPNATAGSSPTLSVDGNPAKEAFLRFNASGLGGPVLRATLRLYATSATANGPGVRATVDTWSEAGLTWNKRPPVLGATADDAGAVAAGAWVVLDVTPLIEGSGIYNFRVATGSGDGVDFESSEAAAHRPELVIKTMPPPPPDGTPPETTIESGPAEVESSRSAAFAFSTDENGSTFECRLDLGAYKPCTSPKGYAGLADGAHRLDIRAVDLAGDRDPTPAVRHWTVDTVPQTYIDSGPSGTATSSSATFAFHASEPDVTFRCSLDGGASVPCSSPKTYDGLLHGSSHTFRVRATDMTGHSDPTTAVRTWTVNLPGAQTWTFAPVADASVHEDTPSANDGSSPTLVADGSPRSRSYLRFALAGMTGQVHWAKLRVHASEASGNGPAAYRTGSGWNESTITWATKPGTAAGALADVGAIASGSQVEYDVTPAVGGNGPVGLALLTTATHRAAFDSREAAADRPALVVTTIP